MILKKELVGLLEYKKKEVEKLKNLISQLNNQVQNLKIEVQAVRGVGLGIKPGTALYVESKTYRGDIRNYSGYLIKDSNKHLVIGIHDNKRDCDYSYIIKKELIGGIKVYNDVKDLTNIKIVEAMR